MNDLMKEISKGGKLRKITDHYGYVKLSDHSPFRVYVVFNILGGYIVCAMKDRRYAIHECKYLEKLNYDKEINNERS